jgi:hypothetical protein
MLDVVVLASLDDLSEFPSTEQARQSVKHVVGNAVDLIHCAASWSIVRPAHSIKKRAFRFANGTDQHHAGSNCVRSRPMARW